MTSSRRFQLSLFLGNLLEHYDNALFGLLTPFLAPLFFPHQDPLTALISIYAIIPIGMMARPLGSLFFGHVGDTKGRKEALFWSLLGMAIVTGLMGLIPSYAVIGVAGPVLLAIGRIGQNFFAAGETIGGGVCLLENTPESKECLTSSYYTWFTTAGIFLGSVSVSLLCFFDLAQDYWRLLFVFGSGTAFSAWTLRKNADQIVMKTEKKEKKPLSFTLKVLWDYRYSLLKIVIVSGFSYSSFSVGSVLMNGFIPLLSENTRASMMHLNSVLLLINMAILPLFGWLAYKYSAERMMLLASVVGVLSAIPLFSMVSGASFFEAFLIRLSFIVIGVAFSAPFYAWSKNLVPAEHRYTLVSVGYALGSQIFGGPTASLSLWIFKTTNLTTAAAAYWIFLGLMTTFLMLKLQTNRVRAKESLDMAG